MLEDETSVLCRLCLQSVDSPINIFDPRGTNGFLVWEVIAELIEFEISLDDGWPTNICRKCMEKLIYYKVFKKMCIDSRTLFLQLHGKQGISMSVEAQERDPAESLTSDSFTVDVEQIKEEPCDEGETVDSEAPLEETEGSNKCASSLEIYLPSNCHPEEMSRGVEEGVESEITVKMEDQDLHDPLEVEYPTFDEEKVEEEEEVEPEEGIEDSEEEEGDVGVQSVDVFPVNAGVKQEGSMGNFEISDFLSVEVIERDVGRFECSGESERELLVRNRNRGPDRNSSDHRDDSHLTNFLSRHDSPSVVQRELLSVQSECGSRLISYDRSQPIVRHFPTGEKDFGTSLSVGGGFEQLGKLPSGGTQGIDPISLDGMEVFGRQQASTSLLHEVKIPQGRRQCSSSGFDDSPEKGSCASKEGGSASLQPGGSEEKVAETSKGNWRKKGPGGFKKIKEPISEEVRQQQLEKNRERNREYYANLSEEKKRAFYLKSLERRKERLEKMSEEEKKEFFAHIRAGEKRRKAAMTPEQKKDYYRRCTLAKKERKQNLTEEKKKELYERRMENLEKRMAGMTDEEREERRRVKNEKKRQRIASLNEEKRAAYLERKRSYDRKIAALKKSKSSS